MRVLSVFRIGCASSCRFALLCYTLPLMERFLWKTSDSVLVIKGPPGTVSHVCIYNCTFTAFILVLLH